MLSRIPLVSLVLLASSIALIATVLVFLGAPMAGDWSAIVAAVVAGALTIPMALAFSHHEHVDPGH
jgi:hypothetical protein